jgi:hypothetical protein
MDHARLEPQNIGYRHLISLAAFADSDEKRISMTPVTSPMPSML